MYEELFQSKLTKKFTLIAKKNNLGPSETKLLNEFLKKLVDMEAMYHKMEGFKNNCP